MPYFQFKDGRWLNVHFDDGEKRENGGAVCVTVPHGRCLRAHTAVCARRHPPPEVGSMNVVRSVGSIDLEKLAYLREQGVGFRRVSHGVDVVGFWWGGFVLGCNSNTAPPQPSCRQVRGGGCPIITPPNPPAHLPARLTLRPNDHPADSAEEGLGAGWLCFYRNGKRCAFLITLV